MIFELASTATAICPVLQEFKVGNKNSQDLKKWSVDQHLFTIQLFAVTEQSYKVMEVTHVPFKVKAVNQNANYYSMTKHFKPKWVVV